MRTLCQSEVETYHWSEREVLLEADCLDARRPPNVQYCGLVAFEKTWTLLTGCYTDGLWTSVKHAAEHVGAKRRDYPITCPSKLKRDNGIPENLIVLKRAGWQAERDKMMLLGNLSDRNQNNPRERKTEAEKYS